MSILKQTATTTDTQCVYSLHSDGSSPKPNATSNRERTHSTKKFALNEDK